MIPAIAAQPWSEGLVERCADGDEVAWSDLYRKYEEVARRFLLRMGVAPELVDDTCQEVFLQAFRYLPGFRGECSFKTWLYRICVTEARRSRHRLRLSRVLAAVLLRSEQSSLTSGDFGEERSSQLIQNALSELSEADRLVFVLYELEGVAGREIAEIVDCPEATVWRRLHYARKAFRSYINEHGVQA